MTPPHDGGKVSEVRNNPDAGKDPEMGKKDKDPREPKDDLQKHLQKKVDKHLKDVGVNKHEYYCPKCMVRYPSNDSSHAGH